MKLSIDERLEGSMADYFWAPDDVQVVDRPELGYAHSPRDSSLFNCVFRTRPSKAAALADLVSEVASAHAGRKSSWVLNPMSDTPELRELLGESGYVPGDEHYGYAIHVDAYDREPRSHVEVRRVTTLSELKDLVRVRNEAFGNQAVQMSDDDFVRELAGCAPEDGRIARFVAYVDERPVGCGGLTNHPRLEFGFLWSGGVIASHRGQGAYTALLRARIDWARRQGLEYVGLYAKLGTSAPIVAAHGFERQGHMHVWNGPA